MYSFWVVLCKYLIRISVKQPTVFTKIFSWFFSVRQRKCRGSYTKLGHHHFLSHPCQFIVYCCSVTRLLCNPIYWRRRLTTCEYTVCRSIGCDNSVYEDFWDMTACFPVNINPCACPCFMVVSLLTNSSTLKMEQTLSSEASVDFRRIRRHYIPDDRSLYSNTCQLVTTRFTSSFKLCLASSAHRIHCHHHDINGCVEEIPSQKLSS
jgi:hypothetical protein